MMAGRVARRVGLLLGATALVGMGAVTACSAKDDKPAPSMSTSATASLSPSNKAVPGAITPDPNAGGGSNSGSGRPAPTAVPGNGLQKG